MALSFRAFDSFCPPESQITEKDGRLQVSIEYVNWLNEERRKINKVDLANIDFYQNGEKVEISEKKIKRFRFIGLVNIDFILTGFYAEEGNDDFWENLE